MITLSELLSKVALPPLTRDVHAPGWKELRLNGGGIVEQAIFDDDTYIEVYANGYVYYQSGTSKTRFSITDVLEDYEYTPLKSTSDLKRDFDRSFFEDRPWIIRVLMEGDDRIEASQQKSRAKLYSTDFDTTIDEHGTYGCDENDPLTIMLKAELSEMLYQSFLMMTEYQQEVVEACILEGLKHWEAAEIHNVSRQAITKAIKNGLTRFRIAYEEMYGDK